MKYYYDDYCCCDYPCCHIDDCSKPSYATFWQSNFITIPLNSAFYFNFTGPKTNDISLINPSTIKVYNAGIYHISYRVAVDIQANTNPSNFVDQRVSLYLNGTMQPNTQTSFGILAPDSRSCIPISGDSIVEIPANSTLQLKNDGDFTGSSSITTCNNGVNAVTFNIIKIS